MTYHRLISQSLTCELKLTVRTVLQTLRGKCPYLEFFWSAFFRIWTEYGEMSLHIQFEWGKMRIRKTPNTDTFHAVKKLYWKVFSIGPNFLHWRWNIFSVKCNRPNWHLPVQSNNGSTRTICEICSQWRSQNDAVLVSLFLTLNRFHILLWCFFFFFFVFVFLNK